MSLPSVRLKNKADRRVRAGHPWIFSNEINTTVSPLKSFTPGETVIVEAHDKTILGVGYINPNSLISVRLFSRNPNERLTTDFFKQQLTKALQLRQSLFKKPYYRLIFSESDGIPGLIIDRFGQDFVFQLNTLGIDQHGIAISEALRAIEPETHSILLRNDSSGRKLEGLENEVKPLFGQPPQEVVVEENNVRFFVPLWEGQKTGWFYDHRLNRARLKNYVRDKNVLDGFSYLGAFGLQAAHAGAKHVDCIEVSASACDYIKRNAELNEVAGKVNIICDDGFDALKSLLKTGKQYEVITLDPPAFVKKAKDKKEGLIAYQRINELAIKLLQPGGVLMSCSCSMHVSMDDLMQITNRIAFRTRSQLQILERGHQGPDHPIHPAIPETDYLKAILIRKVPV